MGTTLRVRRTLPPVRGYSFVEVVVVVALLGILATMGIPLLQNVIHRTKMEGLIGNTTGMFRFARSESIKQNFNTVLRFDFANRRLEAFADLNGTALTDPPDGVFSPVPFQPARTTDYRLGGFELPVGIEVEAPGSLDPIDGFTSVDNGGTAERVAIFTADGSITDIGGIRLADARGNFFEVRVAPQGTARIQVLKWDEIEQAWFEKGEDGRPWVWS